MISFLIALVILLMKEAARFNPVSWYDKIEKSNTENKFWGFFVLFCFVFFFFCHYASSCFMNHIVFFFFFFN